MNQKQKDVAMYAKEIGRKIAYSGIYNVSFKNEEEILGIISLISLNYLKENSYSNKTLEEKLILRDKLFSILNNSTHIIYDSLDSKVL